jgi:hypothetical protein
LLSSLYVVKLTKFNYIIAEMVRDVKGRMNVGEHLIFASSTPAEALVRA